ncbi:MAG: hypothetical protein M3348_18240 [Acidobacteriota bacterium]|nr:hypothetical protein [Acidobacteriota bacterium]
MQLLEEGRAAERPRGRHGPLGKLAQALADWLARRRLAARIRIHALAERISLKLFKRNKVRRAVSSRARRPGAHGR